MFKTRAVIQPAALAHNLGIVRQQAAGCRVLAVVKADAYGHGLDLLLPTLATLADGLGVARLSEASRLREAGYAGRLLLLCGITDAEELALAFRLRLDLVVHEPSQLAILEQAAADGAHPLHLWPKVDTGMHRLGFHPSAFAAACQRLRALPWCASLTGMTHFASADEPGKGKTADQIARFQQATNGLGLDSSSLANSAGLLAWPGARQGWVRPGLMLYGINPLQEADYPLALQPVMTLEGQVIATREIEPGETVGYNDTWCAHRSTRVAYVAAGYADGYPITLREPSHVAFGTQQLPVIGRVSMDTLAIDCTDSEPSPHTGDWVELWGSQIPVAEVARCAGSIPYQLLTTLSGRIPRITAASD